VLSSAIRGSAQPCRLAPFRVVPPPSAKQKRENADLVQANCATRRPSAADRHDREVVRELVAAGLKGEVLVAEVMRLTGLPTSDARTLIWVEIARPVLYGTTLEEITDKCPMAVS
jgi:hypothetical protein